MTGSSRPNHNGILSNLFLQSLGGRRISGVELVL